MAAPSTRNIVPLLPLVTVLPGYQRIVGPLQLATSATDLFTVPTGMRVEIRGVHVNNPSGGEIEFTLSVDADAAGTRLLDQKAVGAGDSYNGRRAMNHTLVAGEKLQGFCDAASTAVLVIDGYVRPTE